MSATAMKKAPVAGAESVEHPRFDRCRFEICYDPATHGESPALAVLSSQPRRLLEVLHKETKRRHNREITGVRLREVLEDAKQTMFPETRQREVFRIFQDYRARFVRAGFIRILPEAM